MDKCGYWEEEVEVAQLDRKERGGWSNKLDFLFSCISLSVGLGNVWRFPYLCYKNGGGAFLVTYGIAMIFCGIPMFFQEVAIGQYLGSGGSTLVGQLCPILQGVGYATMTIVFLLDLYYCIIIAWTLFYLISTFAWIPELPWSNCDNWWNSKSCFVTGMNATLIHNYTNQTRTPVEEFWQERVLGQSGGIADIGGMRWELLACLVMGWCMVYLVICRGIHQSGKVIWFTAIFPYIVLLILLVRGLTLPGAGEGLLYYVTPRWEELLSPVPWIDGATQIFFAYSIGTGALPALGSYNNFNHNCYRDAVITCIINTITSLLAGCVTFAILGNIALEQGTSVANVVSSGPGLVFLTYPEAVLKLPGATAWAVIFFLMLITLGVDSEFCLVESFVTGMVDNWPKLLRPHRGKFTFLICLLLCLLGIPMVTKGGIFIFQLMDYYSASGMCLLWVCIFQTIAISWVFGGEKVIDCIDVMMGIRPNRFWYFCWVYLSPAVMIGIFIFYVLEFIPVTYGSYEYPTWAQIIGICISLASMLWIPGYAVYYFIVSPGSFKQRLKDGLQPRVKVRSREAADVPKLLPMSESSAVLLSKTNSFVVSQ
ncbi:sodium- and chloride-dependent GABA transporter 1-like [Rhodnius prolixus]|uniref:sodium- and chloride-dependent GABA transporter 1-like n=1 Tax=Rhodnius prolixus TaxID=13249 RepID=UPI003D18A8CF